MGLASRWEFAGAVRMTHKRLGLGSIASAIIALEGALYGQPLVWQVSLAVALLLILAAVFESGYEEYLKGLPGLEILKLDDSCFSSFQRLHVLPAGGINFKFRSPHENQVFCFKIRNKSAVSSVTGVKVKLTSTEPSITVLSQRLLMVRYEHLTCFNLNPEEVKEIAFLNLDSANLSVPLPHESYLPFPPGEYKMTIEASGLNVPPVRKTFEVWVTPDGQLMARAHYAPLGWAAPS